MIKHGIWGEFTFRVFAEVKPSICSLPHKRVFLRHLENLSKEELLGIIYNGSYTDQPVGVTELDVGGEKKDSVDVVLNEQA